jgi:hypothetical protein
MTEWRSPQADQYMVGSGVEKLDDAGRYRVA